MRCLFFWMVTLAYSDCPFQFISKVCLSIKELKSDTSFMYSNPLCASRKKLHFLNLILIIKWSRPQIVRRNSKKCHETLKNLTAYVQVVAGPMKVWQDLFSSMQTEPIIRGYISPSMRRLIISLLLTFVSAVIVQFIHRWIWNWRCGYYRRRS